MLHQTCLYTSANIHYYPPLTPLHPGRCSQYTEHEISRIATMDIPLPVRPEAAAAAAVVV